MANQRSGSFLVFIGFLMLPVSVGISSAIKDPVTATGAGIIGLCISAILCVIGIFI